MKFKKIFAAAAASALAVSVLATSASAGLWYQPEAGQEVAPGCAIEANWLVQLFNTGNPDENKPATDYGIDPLDIYSMTAYFTYHPNPEDGLTFDMLDPQIDTFSGTMIYSSNGGSIGTSAIKSEIFDEATGTTLYSKFNWPSLEFWGLPAEGDTPEGQEAGTNLGYVDYGKKLHVDYVTNHTYSLTYNIADEDHWIIGTDDATCFQVGVAHWPDMTSFIPKMELFACYGKDGEVIIAFDGLGYRVDDDEYEAILADFNAGKLAPADDSDASGDDTTAAGGDEQPSENANDTTTAAPADTTTAAPTTTAAASSSSSSSNVGLIIGIIAAVVVVVVVVVIIVIKKKKS